MTEFTKKVYTAVCKIPTGQTKTYQEIAKEISRPKAYRAVGNALNKNTNPGVPCHRVIRSNGQIGGFNKGSSKKLQFLKKERGAKIKVAVLMGGPSLEHAVSLSSGKEILANLDKQKYKATPIVISKKGKWPISKEQLKEFDIALIAAMHGEYGEDGKLQRELERLKIPFTGSGSKASKLGMNKTACDEVFRNKKLLTPKFIKAKRQGTKNPFGYPVVVKPNDRGSSIGIYISKNQSELTRDIKRAYKFSSNILLQEFIQGRELTCGVLERGGRPKPLIPTEIVPKTKTFYDYEAKYVHGASDYVTPPDLPAKMIKTIQKQSLITHKATRAKDYSRTDFILSNKNKLYTIEINTLPGMTATSLLPQGAKATGINFKELLNIIIAEALAGGVFSKSTK